MDTIDKKLFCYTISSKEDLTQIFQLIKTKINSNYQNLEKRELVYNSVIDGYKFFLDVRDEVNLNLDDNKGTLKAFKCILYKLRDKDFPYLFDLATGNKSEIEASKTEVLMEQTHFIVFPEINFIISEYNYHGAGVNKLIHLVDKILGPKFSTEFRVDHILEANIISKIRNLKKIDEFKFRAGHQGLATIQKYTGIGGLDALCGTFDNASELEFEIKIKGKGRSKTKKNFEFEDMEKFKELCKKINESKDKNSLDIQSAKLKDPTISRSLSIDLFEQYMVKKIKAIRLNPNSKYIDSEDMFNKILEVYNNNDFEFSNYKKINLK